MKPRMKPRIAVLAALVAALVAAFLCGCLISTDPEGEPTKPENEGAPSSGKTKVGVITRHAENPFFQSLEAGSLKAGEDLGLDVVVKRVKLRGGISAQIAAIDELAAAGARAIVISPASSDDGKLLGALRRAEEKGIHVVNVDNEIDPVAKVNFNLTRVPFIGVENEKAAHAAAKCLADRLSKKTDAVVLSGPSDARKHVDRETGVLAALRENDDVNVVAVENLDGGAKSAYLAMARLARLNRRIGVVACGNDLMAYGVINCLRKLGKRDALVSGFDDLEGMRRCLKNGDLTATVNPDADSQGYLAVKFANDLIQGETVPLKVTVDFALVKSGKKE